MTITTTHCTGGERPNLTRVVVRDDGRAGSYRKCQDDAFEQLWLNRLQAKVDRYAKLRRIAHAAGDDRLLRYRITVRSITSLCKHQVVSVNDRLELTAERRRHNI